MTRCRIIKLFVLVWFVKTFWTYYGALDFINQLSPERSLEAKIVMSDYKSPFYVFYRAEKS